MMKSTALFLFSLLFLVSCQMTQTQTNQTEIQTPAVQQQQPEQPQAVTVIKCEDSDGNNSTIKGKVILTYSNGQKESLSDECVKGDGLENVFPFETEYLCDGTIMKTKVNHCQNACVNGACT